MHQRVAGEVQRVEQVVARDDCQTQSRQQSARQPEQCGQGNHAQTDCPDNLQVNHARRDLERPGEVDQGELQHHQKKSALEQKVRNGRPPCMFLPVQKR